MTDRATIRAAAFEVLHPLEAASPSHLASLAGCTEAELVGALGSDKRFTRAPGDRCWWWKLTEKKTTKAERRQAEAATMAANRVQTADRERIRGALQANAGGLTIGRIGDLTGIARADIERALVSMQSGNEVAPFTVAGLDGYRFWKVVAA